MRLIHCHGSAAHLSHLPSFPPSPYLHRLPPQDEEIFCSHHHEAHELVAEDLLDLISLFNSDADTHGVNGALYQNLFFVISADDDWLQQQLFAAPVTHSKREKSVYVRDATVTCMSTAFSPSISV